MKIVIFGADGRVGKAVCALARQRNHEVVEIEKSTDTENISDVDVAIDFSVAQATQQVCEFCESRHCALVTGVTGRNEQEQQFVDRLKDICPVVESSNFSKGIEATRQVCKTLAQLGWDCEIVETHRKGKKDSPSGTAKDLATTIVANGTRIVQIHALRCGSNFGKHQIVFATQGESITVTHQAENCEIFARGALDTAEKLVKHRQSQTISFSCARYRLRKGNTDNLL